MSNEKYVLLLGSNLGDRHHYLAEARTRIDVKIGRIIRCSSIHETEPWGFDAESSFLNQAVLIETSLQPLEILDRIHLIEESLGRKRIEGTYQSRTIDIDILCAEHLAHNSDSLEIPHPLLHHRLFALEPLIELTPNWIHPQFDTTYQALLTDLRSKSTVTTI